MVNNSWYKIVQINAWRKIRWCEKLKVCQWTLKYDNFFSNQLERKEVIDFMLYEQANEIQGRKNVGLHKFNLTSLQKLLERCFSVFSIVRRFTLRYGLNFWFGNRNYFYHGVKGAMSLLEVNQLKFRWIIYGNFLHAEICIDLIQHSLILHHHGKLVFIDLCMYSTKQNFIASLHIRVIHEKSNFKFLTSSFNFCLLKWSNTLCKMSAILQKKKKKKV